MVELPAIDGLPVARAQAVPSRAADDGFSRLLDQRPYRPQAAVPVDAPAEDDPTVRSCIGAGAPVEVPMRLVATGRLAYGVGTATVDGAWSAGGHGSDVRHGPDAPAARAVVVEVATAAMPLAGRADAATAAVAPPPGHGTSGPSTPSGARAAERWEPSPLLAPDGQLPAARLLCALPTERGAVVVFRDYRLDRIGARAVADALARGAKSLASSVVRILVNGVTVFQQGRSPDRREG